MTKNNRGGFTVRTTKLYPHQWIWDSAFTALGISTYNKIRAWQELILLINAEWKNGMIPHIIFHENNPNYFLGPNHWQIKTNANGLENEGEYSLAKRIKDDNIKLIEVGGMYEYFNPHTGKGLGGKNFSWTVAILLALGRDSSNLKFTNN